MSRESMHAYLGVVQHVELLSRVTASIEDDGLLPSWVVGQELMGTISENTTNDTIRWHTHVGNIQNLPVDDYPNVLLLIVLGDLLSSELL